MDTEYDGPTWEPWKYGLQHAGFEPLMTEYNTVLSSIQDYGTFCKDFEEIARTTQNQTELRYALSEHRKNQLRHYRSCLADNSNEISISYSRLPEELWNDMLDLISPTKPGDILSWESPISLQALMRVLDHLKRRLSSTTPLDISPPTHAAPPSADATPIEFINHQPPESTGELLARKLPQEKTQRKKETSKQQKAIIRGRMETRDSFLSQPSLRPRKDRIPKMAGISQGGVEKSRIREKSSRGKINT